MIYKTKYEKEETLWEGEDGPATLGKECLDGGWKIDIDQRSRQSDGADH